MLPRQIRHRMPQLRILLRLRTTRLPDGIPRRDALVNPRAPEIMERQPPRQIRRRVPARDLRVPGQQLRLGRQAGHDAGLELGEVVEVVRARLVAQVVGV